MKIRSFVAIDLPQKTKAILEKESQRLQSQAPPQGIRWSRVAGIHLTLKFLGDVEQAYLPKIKAALAEVGGRHVPFELTVGGLGCFPNVRRPRVVWVGVQEPSGALDALQRDVEAAMTSLGFPPEKRSFHPHLTLGRTRRNVRSSDRRRLGEIVAEDEGQELDRIQVVSFRLMRSDLRPDGAVYTPLAEFALQG